MKVYEHQQPTHYSAWTPPEGACAVAAGNWWDAIRVDEALGITIVRYLRLLSPSRLGPVIADHDMTIPSIYFLTLPGTAAHWTAPHSRALGHNCYIVVPSLGRITPPGPHWLVSPQHSDGHTDPESLRRILDLGLADPTVG
ncbi:hypothetical protein [Streptomyces sp. NBC_00079]|uniref:hypothetical protein n=1 Tax=Streptomyces sp. NBC_00079 TaxID=2975644 RepID=UPI00324C06E9